MKIKTNRFKHQSYENGYSDMMIDDAGAYILFTDYKALLDKYNAEQAITAGLTEVEQALLDITNSSWYKTLGGITSLHMNLTTKRCNEILAVINKVKAKAKT
jgi:hypothetical protein